MKDTFFWDAFVSYGRADSLIFCKKLYDRLRETGLKIWFDQNDIPFGVDFQNEIDDGIEKSHNFLFVIAPHSVNSPYCLKEIERAVRRNKRIIPLLHVEEITRETWQQRNPQGTDEEWEAYQEKGLHSSFPKMHPTIGKINWVYFREGIDDFEKSLADLIELLQRDRDYVEQHTHLLAKALEWQRQDRKHSSLLIADEKQQAQDWLKRRFKNQQPPCLPTDLHCEYITESIKNANNLMTQVFIAYADDDKATMEKIRNSLRRESITVWTNTTDIHTGETFETAIQRGIEQADNMVYLLSPDSVNSYSARKELEMALSLNKRIIPVLVRETLSRQIPEGVRDLRYIDLTENVKEEDDLLDESQLLKTLRRDEAYYREHKVLLAKALKWQRQSDNPSILLRGYNLRSAEAWLKVAPTQAKTKGLRPPTALMAEFIEASLQQPPAASLDVFVSYSRADSDFARKLNDELQLQGKTTWFDQESIATGTDFAAEIRQGIRACDNFLFVLSPRSVQSPYCKDEVEYAASLNKRFVTVLHRRVEKAHLHPELAKVQWLDFQANDRDFDANFRQLRRTLETDREHLRSHTKWTQRALEWEQKNKTKDLLLRGSELVVARDWWRETQEQKKQPAATALQKAYIAKSGGLQRRNRLLLTGAVVGVLGVVTFLWLDARRQATQAILRENAARVRLLLPLEPTEAMVRAIQATGKSRSSLFTSHEVLPQVQSSLRDAIEVARERDRLPGHEGGVLSVSFSPDGNYIVSGGGDGTLRLWDRQSNAIGSPFKGHEGGVSSVAFSPDGNRILSGAEDGTVRLWDSQGNAIGSPFKGHEGGVSSVAFSPDGERIVSGGGDGTLRLWDRQSNAIGDPFIGHEGGVSSVTFSPDGNRILSGGIDETVRLWDRQGNPVGDPFKGHDSGVVSVAFSPDGSRILSGDIYGTLRLWDSQGNPVGDTLQGHGVVSVAFSPDGNYIVSGSGDGTVRLWDSQGNPIGDPLMGHEYAIYSIAFSPDGNYIVSGGGDGTVRLWDRQGNAIGDPFKGHDSGVVSVAFSPDGNRILSGDIYGTLWLWDAQGHAIGSPFKGHDSGVVSVAFSPDGNYILSGGRDGTVRLWDSQGNPIGSPFIGHRGVVFSVAFSPDGNRILSGAEDGTVRLWDAQGNPIGSPFIGHRGVVFSVAFSPDGNRILSGGIDGTVRLWDRQGNAIGDPFKGHDSGVVSVAFSPDGNRILSGGGDGTVRLWDAQGHAIGDPFIGHRGVVFSVAFSPDGNYILSGGRDGTVRLWDRQGHAIGDPLQGHEYGVRSVTFSPNGSRIVSGAEDGTVRLWRGGTWQSWMGVACDRLIAHPVLVTPETLLGEDSETLKIARDAAQICQNSVWNDTQNAEFLASRGRAIAREGDVRGAMAQFREARKLSASIDVPSEEEVGWWAAGGLANKGEQLVRDGNVGEALEAYREAQALKPTWKLYAKSWNTLCRYGSLHGEPAEVMFACENALELAPNNGDFRESRGLVRALTGDTAGAIEDFQAYIDSTDSEEGKKQRQDWIEALKKGENPFTEEAIESLLRER